MSPTKNTYYSHQNHIIHYYNNNEDDFQKHTETGCFLHAVNGCSTGAQLCYKDCLNDVVLESLGRKMQFALV